MAGELLFKDATIVATNGTFIGDCRVKNGVIYELGNLHPQDNEKVFDATGLHLLPGAIDPQVHFREPGKGDLECIQTGSMAAASGGITSFLDMPNNIPAATTLASIQAKLDSAAKTSVINYGFFIGATSENLEELQKAVGKPSQPIHIPGICGIKIFMGSSTGDLLVDEEEALEVIFSETEGVIAVHAEDEERLVQRFETLKHRTDMAAHAEWRDSETALLATQRAVRLARIYGRKLHILHLTSGLEADWLVGKTNLVQETVDGGRVSTEVLPQHLTFDQQNVEKEGTRLKMNPPIRYSEDKETLWKRLIDGTIQCIATDHAPHLLSAKTAGWPSAPSGMPGVETSLAVMLTHAKNGKCTIEDVVRWMSTNPAVIYGMKGKGKIEIGQDADLALVDMNSSMKVDDSRTWSKVGWNPFHGRELVGWTIATFVGGVQVFERNLNEKMKGNIIVAAGQTGKPLEML